jgi:hypothetical protein
MEKYLSIGKAVKILAVTPKTLRRWELAKAIQSNRTHPHGMSSQSLRGDYPSSPNTQWDSDGDA